MARTPDEMANELENSEVEVSGQMAEDLMAQEVNRKLGEDDPPATNLVAEPEPKQAEPAPDVKPVDAKPVAAQEAVTQPAPEPPTKIEPVSFLDSLEDEEDGGQPAETPKAPGVTPGMIRDIQSEREKRKAAEQQVAEYQRQLAEYEAQKQAAEQQIDLDAILGEGEDDDFLDRKTAKQIVQAAAQQARQTALAEFQQREQAAMAQAAKQQRQQAMQSSETAIRKTVKDYDTVVGQAMKLNILTVEDKRMILSSPNPAGTLYFKAKQVLNAFGIQPTVMAPQPATSPATVPETPKTPTEPSGDKDEIQSDEELYDSIFVEQS